MNPGTFQGAGTGTTVGTISRYIQIGPITTSQTIQVPPGTQRIEALLCGGGGGGYGKGQGPGGGFGGMAVFAIPVTGQPLVVTIGAGGTAGLSYPSPYASATAGSPTYITSGKTVYASIGGGATGGYYPGQVAGAGGGGGGISSDYAPNGGGIPLGTVLWHAQNPTGKTGELRQEVNVITAAADGGGTATSYVYGQTNVTTHGAGMGGGYSAYVVPGGPFNYPIKRTASYGFGGAGNGGTGINNGGGNYYGAADTALFGAGGAPYGTYISPGPGAGGGGAGGAGGTSGYYNFAGAPGGSLTSVSIWGFTGFPGSGTGNGYYNGGGGGGMLAASPGPDGGLGGGGGGGGGYNGPAGANAYQIGGAGGAGFAAIRFYL